MSKADDPFLTASVSGLAVYLDNWSIGDLAEADPARRTRFIRAMRSGVDLLFSATNAAELSGPQGRSADSVRAFLDEIGPHWFPVELDATEVVKREMDGESPERVCVSRNLLIDYVAHRLRHYTPGCGRVIDLSENFFCLGAILDWVGPQRDSIRRGCAELDDTLRRLIGAHADQNKRNPRWLNEKWLPMAFHPARPGCFAYSHLMRTLVLDGVPLREGDGMDFCHAVMATAFAHFATLDKRWKHRVARLPKPNGLARIYYGPELDQMVTDLEAAANQFLSNPLDREGLPGKNLSTAN
jgi:hypothetical protein